MKPIIIYILILVFTVINTAQEIKKPDEINNVKFEWQLKNIGAEDSNPITQINLTADGKGIFSAEGYAIKIIGKDNWDQYKIPKAAIIACGGWWAGAELTTTSRNIMMKFRYGLDLQMKL